MLSTLLRRPFAELYSTHPGTSLRLSAAILATIIYDRIAPSWKSGDSQSKNDWEQVATVLLAGVQVLDAYLYLRSSVLTAFAHTSTARPIGSRGRPQRRSEEVLRH
jgi:hypothetical protein